MVLNFSWVSRQKVEMDRRMKKSEPKATYCGNRNRDDDGKNYILCCIISFIYTRLHSTIYLVSLGLCLWHLGVPVTAGGGGGGGGGGVWAIAVCEKQ